MKYGFGANTPSIDVLVLTVLAEAKDDTNKGRCSDEKIEADDVMLDVVTMNKKRD